MKPLDNHLTIDEEWDTFGNDEYEGEWDRLCREADEEYDSRFDFCNDFYTWSKHEDGYIF